jgi:ATP-dependent DNA helicase RecG
VESFEVHPVPASKDLIVDSSVTIRLLENVVASAHPETWLKKQALIVNDMPTIAGILLFSEEPQAQLPTM